MQERPCPASCRSLAVAVTVSVIVAATATGPEFGDRPRRLRSLTVFPPPPQGNYLRVELDQLGGDMQIACIGRGNIGGGLGDLWEQAGHQVTRLGHDGGDVSAAEAVLLAVPGGAVAEVLGKVRGLVGKIVIDATNRYGTKPPDGYPSNAEYAKSRTNGPTAKSFNLNIASLLSRLAEARATPCNLWCGDEEAREVVERLNRDAGYEPVCTGSLENAATHEAFAGLIRGIAQGGMGPFVYRMAPPDRL